MTDDDLFSDYRRAIEWIRGCKEEKHTSACPKFDDDYASTCTCDADASNLERYRILTKAKKRLAP